MTDRLTTKTARVGMRVRCADADGDFHARDQLVKGQVYAVIGRREPGSDIWLEGVRSSWQPSRFIPADPQPDQSLRAILAERAPDLLAALVEWRQARQLAGSARALFDGIQQLYDAIERAGLLPEPKQPAPLPAMFCGADAFTQENDDGR